MRKEMIISGFHPTQFKQTISFDFNYSEIGIGEDPSVAIERCAEERVKAYNEENDLDLTEWQNIYEKSAENTAYLMFGNEAAFYCPSDKDFIIYMESMRNMYLQSLATGIWKEKEIQSVTSAFTFFRDCLKFDFVLLKINIDNLLIESAIKHVEDKKTFYNLSPSMGLKREDLDEVFTKTHTPNSFTADRFEVSSALPVVGKYLTVFHDINSLNINYMDLEIDQFLVTHNINNKKETFSQFHKGFVREFSAFKDDQEVIVLVYPTQNLISISYAENGKYIYHGSYSSYTVVQENSLSSQKMYNKEVSVQFTYDLDFRLFYLFLSLEKKITKKFKIEFVKDLTSDTDKSKMILNFDFFNRFAPDHFDNLYEMLSAGSNQDQLDDLNNFISMLKQFVQEDGHSNLCIYCLYKESYFEEEDA